MGNDAVGYALLKQLTALSAGRLRVPRFQPLTWLPMPEPSNVLDGVDVAEATVANVAVVQDWTPGRFTVWMRFDVVPAGAEFRLELSTWMFGGRREYSVTSPTGSAAEAASLLVIALLAEPVVATGVNVLSAVVDDADPSVVRIELDVDVAFSLGLSDLFPTSAARVWADARFVAWEAWGLDKTLRRWQRVDGAQDIRAPRSRAVPVDVSGFERVYVRATATDGLCVPAVFVSELETRTFTMDAAVEALTATRATLLGSLPATLLPSNGTLGLGTSAGTRATISQLPTTRTPVSVDIASAVRGIAGAFGLALAPDPLTERRLIEFLQQLDPAGPILAGGLGYIIETVVRGVASANEERPDRFASAERGIAGLLALIGGFIPVSLIESFGPPPPPPPPP